MGLGDALNIARNSLDNSQRQMGVISQNLSGVDNPNYTHRTLKLHTMVGGGASVVIERDADYSLLTNYFVKSSRASGSVTLAAGLKQLDAIYSADEFGGSPAALINKLRSSMQLYVNHVSSNASADGVIADAQTLAGALNFGSKQVEKLRADADKEIGENVAQIRELLHKLETVQQHIKRESGPNIDIYLDEQDAILKDLSSHITINVEKKEDGTITLYAANGVTLFDKVASKIEYEPTRPLMPGKPGKEVKIDGMPLSNSAFVKPNGDGSLGNLLKLRDEICVKYEAQLDAIAKGLLDVFKNNKDDKVSGLFIDQRPGELAGMAGRIALNHDFMTTQGGHANLPSDKAQMQKLIDKLSDPKAFEYKPGVTGLHEGESLIEFARSSLGWLGSVYQNVQQEAEYNGTMFSHAEQFLSDATGVNKDDELALMLEVEQSYGASAKLVSAVGKMMDDLFAAIR